MCPGGTEPTMILLLTKKNRKTSGREIDPELEESLERSRKGSLHSDRDTCDLPPTGGEEGHPDFRTIPIYPTAEELHQKEKPFVRPIIASECYTNLHHYLDTQFRLLREDFMQPLRDGIQQLQMDGMSMGERGSPLKKKHFDGIRLYFNTKLLVPQCTHVGISYTVQFDVQPLRFVHWQDSKRLIYGSLVLLSFDNFKSILFATVSDRDPKELLEGKVQITFTEESTLKLAELQMDTEFLMVESVAYFEAYRYVLDGLRRMNEDNLPFQRYIVECSTDVQPPAYLRGRDTYDLCSIAVPKYRKKLLPFHSLKEEAWPKREELGLDKFQMRALQLALTKELAIIQGPPGTGKTYIGLKIAQAVLTNQSLRNNSFGMPPILVVCFTNHALDQFLEGICNFLEEGIVRVGGRSNSKKLTDFNLTTLLKSCDFKYSLPSYLWSAKKEIYKQLDSKKKILMNDISLLHCSLKEILSEYLLQMFILDRHWNNLKQQPEQKEFSRKKKPSLITEWLCLDSIILQQRETEDEKENEDEPIAAAEEGVLEQEDLIDIAEEEDLTQEEWIIEYDIDHKVMGGDEKNAERETEEVTEAETKTEDRKKRKRMKIIMKELGKTTAMSEEEEGAVLDIWTLNLTDRWRLYQLWLKRYKQVLFTRVQKYQHAYQNAVDRLTEVKDQERICLLRKARVIGMTTTGAAKYRNILQQVRPHLVIVEEAAEVLEAHTITSLSQSCQHLILIGDHQQLRPSTTVYELAKDFNLDISMFERLVKVALPFVRLSLQHRMRPEIASLLTPHIYSELENHPSVYDYENIKGLNTNLFFVEHSHFEEGVKDGTSYQNKHEAMFLVALCRYLLLQEYKPEQITILTTYRGQYKCLQKLMSAHQLKGVQVQVVDKYQGEENDIVLLSLVRGNPQGKVGFLSTSNRVCVALSRAKKGLYCVGNSAVLRQVKLWRNIFDTLRKNGQIGNELILCCQNHPDRKAKATCAEDFEQAPDGGCTQPCNFLLKCGHVCPKFCHPYDPKHEKNKCVENCQKIICDLGHVCTRLCHEECLENCPVMLPQILPQCQHLQYVPCHQDPATFACQTPCQRRLPCGHPCDSLCGEECSRKCKVKVSSKLSCGHVQEDACFAKSEEADDPICRVPCNIQLKCGHKCLGTCGKCCQGQFHLPCVPCDEPCECKYPSNLCHSPSDCSPCAHPCVKNLDDSHKRIGWSGSNCASKCHLGIHDEATEIFSCSENEPETSFVQQEDSGHVKAMNKNENQ